MRRRDRTYSLVWSQLPDRTGREIAGNIIFRQPQFPASETESVQMGRPQSLLLFMPKVERSCPRVVSGKMKGLIFFRPKCNGPIPDQTGEAGFPPASKRRKNNL